MNKMLSIVVPCLNEEESLPLFYDEAVKYIGESGELIFIDDGSTDNTACVLRDLQKKRQ